MMEKLLEPRSEHWDEVVDVVVVGYGFAGAAAAIEAHGRGAKILLIEKNATPGGISICSAGGVRIAKDRDAAFTYLKETNAGTTPDGPLAALADGMTTIARFVEDIAEKAGARPVINWMAGTYPFEGGGVTTWCDVILNGLPDIDVHLIAVTGSTAITLKKQLTNGAPARSH